VKRVEAFKRVASNGGKKFLLALKKCNGKRWCCNELEGQKRRKCEKKGKEIGRGIIWNGIPDLTWMRSFEWIRRIVVTTTNCAEGKR